MARDKSVAVSEYELNLLREKRREIFGTDEVPYGVVISTLCEDDN